MLEGLNLIQWSHLLHAYGSAEDTPHHIQNLLSSNPETRVESLEALSSSILHQGTIYQATTYAIPFLYELLASEQFVEKSQVIILLVDIALGSTTTYLLSGFDSEKFRREVKEDIFNMSPENRAFFKEFGTGPEILLACYNAVKKGIPVLYHLCQDKNPKIRRAAIYALSWFPEMSKESIALIRKLLRSFYDEKDIALSILSLGILYKSIKRNFTTSEQDFFLNQDARLVRVCSGIAIADENPSERVIDVLLLGLKYYASEQLLTPDFYFHGGYFFAYLMKVLSQYKLSHQHKVIPAFCESLKSLNYTQKLSLTGEILSSLNYSRDKSIKNVRPSTLSDLELMALRHIAAQEIWTVDGLVNQEFTDILRKHGVPETYEKLHKYLYQASKPEHQSDFLNNLSSWSSKWLTKKNN